MRLLTILAQAMPAPTDGGGAPASAPTSAPTPGPGGFDALTRAQAMIAILIVVVLAMVALMVITSIRRTVRMRRAAASRGVIHREPPISPWEAAGQRAVGEEDRPET